MRCLFGTSFLVVLALSASSCSRGEPPSFDAGGGASPSVAPLPPSAASAINAPVDAGHHPASDAATDARESQTESGAGDPGSLPQTKDKPSATSAQFTAGVAKLWDAIASDDPERAIPFFFPVGAYEQVKDIPKPAADWKARLVRAYKRDIHAAHKRLGDEPANAKFVRIEVPDREGWVQPGDEGNKIGYFRVYGTKLHFTDSEGRPRVLDVKSLISWRGEWYVVHLSGFK